MATMSPLRQRKPGVEAGLHQGLVASVETGADRGRSRHAGGAYPWLAGDGPGAVSRSVSVGRRHRCAASAVPPRAMPSSEIMGRVSWLAARLSGAGLVRST